MISICSRQAEEQVSLDQLQALVHHRRRVDRDLGAHVPVGMGDGLLGRRLFHLVEARCGTARPRRSGSSGRWRGDGAARGPGRWRCARCPRAAAPSRRLRVTRSPAQTSTSLFASATTAPRRAATRVGSRPAEPTIAAMTQSAGRFAASTTAAGPAAASIAVPASACFSVRYSPSWQTTSGPARHARIASAEFPARRPAPRRERFRVPGRRGRACSADRAGRTQNRDAARHRPKGYQPVIPSPPTQTDERHRRGRRELRRPDRTARRARE